MSDVMIQVENLTKDYGPFRAVDSVSFNVRKGEVLGFLGPNGAGKSTTMKMLTCYLAPTGGTARVAGLDVFDESLEVRKRIGYLPEDTPIYRDMTVREYLDFVAEVRGMPRDKRQARIREIGGRCGLGDVAGKLIGELSKGYRQRVGLAQAMVHDPDIVILDEPTSGLDPNQIVEIRDLIKEVGREKTVILSTHILPEVQATCSRMIIIAKGKVVADGTPDELRARERGARHRVLIELPKSGAGPLREPDAASLIRDRLKTLPGVTRCDAAAGEPGALGFFVYANSDKDVRKDIFDAAVASKWTLLELARESASLEDVFRSLTTTSGEELRS
ncbi:MAG TPA: ATP-binding cassette domain-containing protein [Polyangia bacterium]